MSAMMNCVRCNGGLTKLSDKVVVRLITLFFPFDRTQGLVYGGKVGKVT
jgi:hypothetical protein